jgi:hypothetical protein
LLGAVVVLKNPKLDGDRLTFNVQALEGDLDGGDGAAAVFIDIIGRPLTPLSFAGVAHAERASAEPFRDTASMRRSILLPSRLLHQCTYPVNIDQTEEQRE